MSDGIVIVGGGPVGTTLALALAKKGIASTLLEVRAKGAAYPDGRALALSYGTKVILERLGVWDKINAEVTPINTIHVSQKASIGRTVLKAHEHGLPSLGFVVSYGILSAALDEVVSVQTRVQVQYEAEVTKIEPQAGETKLTYQTNDKAYSMSAQLAILADGGRSLNEIEGLTREVKEYGHDALVAKVETELAHNEVAYERFTPQGPMALLPNGKAFSLVWTGKAEEIQSLLDLDEPTFLKQLHSHFGDRVGQFKSVGKRMTFPLRLATLKPACLPHLAIIGNAAQTMHPVAGQGFNVGIRDAWELATHIADADTADIGNIEMLNAYTDSRLRDTQRGLLFTDFLVNIFSNDLVGLSALRGKGLGLLDMIKPIKQLVVEKMSYGK